MKLPLLRQVMYSSLLVLSAAILTLVSGCVTDGAEGVESMDAAAVARMLPDNTKSLIYVDVEAFRNDDEMSEIYDGFMCFYNIMFTVPTVGKWSGVPFPEISWGASATGLAEDSIKGMTFVIGGGIDRGAIREELAANSWERGEHKGYEVWGYYDITSVAIADDYYIAGRAPDCVDVTSGNRSSLYDRPEVTEFFSKLSPGSFVGMTTDAFPFQRDYEQEPLVQGVSLARNGDRTMSAHGVFIFQDGNEALNALEGIKDAVADGWGWSLDASGIEVSAEDNVVNVRCEIDLEDIEDLANRPELQGQCE